MTKSKIGVGIVGSGLVAQAIHLPVLAARTDIFEVRRIFDIDPAMSARVASLCGANGSTDYHDILDDPDIQVVAICTPDRFHASQLIAAMNVGKRAVLCEKPLAISMTEAGAIREVAEASGTAIFVGTMHAYDPAYRAGLRAWLLTGDRARQIRSAIYLPRNEEFIDQAVELLRSDAPRALQPKGDQSKILMRRAMLGLAIHDLPLIRNFQPNVGKLHSADFLPPFGYALIAEYGDCMTELTAVMSGEWPSKWTFEAIGEHHRLRVNMPPSFVMAGSAQVELEGPDGCQVFGGDVNGYQALWQAIAETVNDNALPPFTLETAIGDLTFALDLADGADALLGVVS